MGRLDRARQRLHGCRSGHRFDRRLRRRGLPGDDLRWRGVGSEPDHAARLRLPSDLGVPPGTPLFRGAAERHARRTVLPQRLRRERRPLGVVHGRCIVLRRRRGLHPARYVRAPRRPGRPSLRIRRRRHRWFLRSRRRHRHLLRLRSRRDPWLLRSRRRHRHLLRLRWRRDPWLLRSRRRHARLRDGIAPDAPNLRRRRTPLTTASHGAIEDAYERSMVHGERAADGQIGPLTSFRRWSGLPEMPRPSKRASPMAVWTPTLQALLDACRRFPPRLDRAAAAADAVDPVVDSLYGCGWFDEHPQAATRVRLALQDLRLERLCGYYAPPSTPEVFELTLRWTTIAWLVDDTLARASSPAALSEAIRDHRRFILPALRGFLVQGAPPLARFIAQHAHRFARVAPRATLVGFQRSAERWLERGTLALATYAMAGLTPT